MITWTDLFSGGGGSSEGLRQAGHQVAICANHWDVAVSTHQKNHPDTEHRLANLSETDFRTFPRTTALWASPSCVWHARSGGRKKPPEEVERMRADAGAIDRATAFAVIAAAEVHAYEAIVVENVTEFQDWVLYDWWLDGLRALGYRAQTAVLNSADVGPDPVPQSRVRYYGVFTRDGNVDLDSGVTTRTPASTILDPNPGKLVTRRLYVSPQIDEITEPNVPHLVTYRRNAKARRADQHQLATVTAGGNHHAVATVTDTGTYHRLLNNRERARAQGFPDGYEFTGTADQVRAQIGNAVSVNVARRIGGRVATALGVAS